MNKLESALAALSYGLARAVIDASNEYEDEVERGPRPPQEPGPGETLGGDHPDTVLPPEDRAAMAAVADIVDERIHAEETRAARAYDEREAPLGSRDRMSRWLNPKVDLAGDPNDEELLARSNNREGPLTETDDDRRDSIGPSEF